MVDFKFTQLPNKALQELRRDFKEEANENVSHRVETAAKQFAARVSSKPVDSISSEPGEAQADKSSAALDPKAMKWADRAVRPYQMGMFYGSNAAHLWDRAFSYVVGRGIKESKNETAFDPSKFWSDGQVRHLALRQEGILGMAVRLPAAALGTAIGKLFKNEANAEKAKQIINEGATTFNGVARLATLGITSGVCATVGVLVGLGVSAVSATVATIAIRKLEKEQAAASAQPAEENSAPAEAGSEPSAGTPSTPKSAKSATSDSSGSFATASSARSESIAAAERAEAPAAAAPAAGFESHGRLAALQNSALKGLQTLQHPYGKILDGLQGELQTLKQKAKEAREGGDKLTIIAADNAVAACQSELKAYGDPEGTRKALVAKLADADKSSDKPLQRIQDPEKNSKFSESKWRRAREMYTAAKNELDAHDAKFTTVKTKPTDDEINAVKADVLTYQEEAFAMAKAWGPTFMAGRGLTKDADAARQAAQAYHAVSIQWARLHKRGLVEKETPMNAHIDAHMATLTQAVASISGSLHAAVKHADEAYSERKDAIQTADKAVETKQNEAITRINEAGQLAYGSPEREALLKQAAASFQEELAAQSHLESVKSNPPAISIADLADLNEQLSAMTDAAGELFGVAKLRQQDLPKAMTDDLKALNEYIDGVHDLSTRSFNGDVNAA